jgi:hypothetical protein
LTTAFETTSRSLLSITSRQASYDPLHMQTAHLAVGHHHAQLLRHLVDGHQPPRQVGHARQARLGGGQPLREDLMMIPTQISCDSKHAMEESRDRAFV